MWLRISLAASFHGFDSRTHHVGAPAGKQRAHDIDLLAIEDLTQLFAVKPSPCRALRGELREVSSRASREK